MSSNIFHGMPNPWLFSSSNYKNLALEDSNFCCEHEDYLSLQGTESLVYYFRGL